MASVQTVVSKVTGKILGHRAVWRDGGAKTPQKSTQLFDTKPQANAALDEIEARLHAERKLRLGVRIPLLELLERYMASSINRAVQKGYSEQYVERRRFYQGLILGRMKRLFVKQGWTTVDDITDEVIERWQLKAKRTEGTSRNLKALLLYARRRCGQPVKEEVIALLSPGKKPDVEPGRLMTPEEVDALEQRARVLSVDAASLVHFLATYGARPITAASIKCKDYDPNCSTVSVEVKNGKRFAFPILPKTCAYFDEQVKGRGPEEPLFVDPRYGQGFAMHARQLLKLNPGQLKRGKPKKDNLGRGFIGFLKDKGQHDHAFGAAGSRDISAFFRNYLGEKSYNLKRFAITTMLKSGMDVKTIMLWTGHTTEAQVWKYGRANAETARAQMHKLYGGAALAPKPAAPAKVKPARAVPKLSGEQLDEIKQALLDELLASSRSHKSQSEIVTDCNIRGNLRNQGSGKIIKMPGKIARSR